MKKHLVGVYNFGSVEKRVGGRPYRSLSGPQRTKKKQSKRYNNKSCSNPISKAPILDAKTKTWYEISGLVR